MADGEGPKVPPVDLSLFAGKRLQAQIRLGTPGPHGPHVAADREHPARIPTPLEHGVQPGRPQPRMLG
jgi:hypothetical protein